MRTLIHLSDLHFGRLDPVLLAPLRGAILHMRPDVLVVSGDLTQRARPSEFQSARDFLETLPEPQIVVPGNHDVPLHNMYARFAAPLREYGRYISEDTEPFYADSEIAVMGINTARSLVWKNGRVNTRQMSRIEDRFCEAGRVVKVLVTHHPFDLPESFRSRDLVGRAHLAMNKIARCGVDLLLAGHFHVSHSGHTALRYNIPGHSAIFVQAGTLSTRSRGESNSFNRIVIDERRIAVERFSLECSGTDFRKSCEDVFHNTARGWVAA